MKRVVFRHKQENMVGAIKSVRALTGLGIAECKTLVQGNNPFIDLRDDTAPELKELATHCYQFNVYDIPDEIAETNKSFRERLEEIAVDAMKERNFEIAEKVMEILKTI